MGTIIISILWLLPVVATVTIQVTTRYLRAYRINGEVRLKDLLDPIDEDWDLFVTSTSFLPLFGYVAIGLASESLKRELPQARIIGDSIRRYSKGAWYVIWWLPEKICELTMRVLRALGNIKIG